MEIICNGCPRKCNAKRTLNDNIGGFCRMPLQPKVARASLHFWEEPIISGTNGSGTIFFSGCSLKCAYCQNFKLSHKDFGKTVTVNRLAEIMKELEEKGAHNINFVNPTHYIFSIEEALKIYKPNIPLVYNSSGYDLPEYIEKSPFDIFLMDFKYFSKENSKKYSFAEDYPEYAKASIIKAYNKYPKPIVEDGIMKKGLIVRHLILPQSTNETINIIDWFCENTPNAYFSLMAQYIPLGNADKFKEINRKITKREYEKTVDYLLNKDIKNAFIQDRSGASEDFVPEFDYTGI